MRIVTLGLASSLLVLALATAAWRSEANAVAAQNQQTESEISRLERVRDRARSEVESLKQPLVVRARRESIAGDGLLLGSLSSTLRAELTPPAKPAPAAKKAAGKAAPKAAPARTDSAKSKNNKNSKTAKTTGKGRT